jgi:pimeloyl-ACP methyl ester carboxylesterase
VLDLLGPATFSEAFYARFAAQMAQRRAAIAAFPRSWFAALADMLASLRGLDVRPYASRVTCPVLVMGAELDRTFPIECSHRLTAAFPDARLEIVAGAPHGMVVEQAAEVASRLAAFWSTIEAGS